jgi:hypothetical protein
MRTEEDRCTDPVAAAVEEEGDRPVLLSYTSVGLPRTDYIFSLVLFFVPLVFYRASLPKDVSLCCRLLMD